MRLLFHGNDTFAEKKMMGDDSEGFFWTLTTVFSFFFKKLNGITPSLLTLNCSALRNPVNQISNYNNKEFKRTYRLSFNRLPYPSVILNKLQQYQRAKYLMRAVH